MPDYTIKIDISNPTNVLEVAIANEIAHIRAHMLNEGITLSSPTVLTGPLRLRVTASGVPSQRIRDHLGLS